VESEQELTVWGKGQAVDVFQMELQETQTSYASALRFLEVMSVVLHELISNLHRNLHSTPNKPLNSEEAGLRGIEHVSYPRVAYLRNKRDSAVAYWAEAEIFGGPVLFARRISAISEVSVAFIEIPNLIALFYWLLPSQNLPKWESQADDSFSS
jgi:hypothetical protein